MSTLRALENIKLQPLPHLVMGIQPAQMEKNPPYCNQQTGALVLSFYFF